MNNANPAPRKYYKTSDIMNLLGIGRTAAQAIMHQFEMKGKLLKYGNTLRVKITDFEEWEKDHTPQPERLPFGVPYREAANWD